MPTLLISLQGIGNTILTTPAIRYLYQQGATLDMIVSDNGSHRIIEALGMVRSIFVYREKENFVKNAIRLKKIINSNYDAVYALQPDGRRENFLSFCLSKNNIGGIKERIGYWKLCKFLVKKKIKLCKDEHDILSNLRLVGAPLQHQDPGPLIVIPSNIEDEVKNRHFSERGKNFVLVLHPFAGQKERRWPIENYIYICKTLFKEKKIKVIIIGAPGDTSGVNYILENVGSQADKFIHDDILYTAALIKHCDLFLGDDSSLMHISAALGKPTLAIWGFTDYRRTSPYGETSLMIKKALDCSPCYSFEYGLVKNCPRNFECLRGISKEDIYDIVSYIMSRMVMGEDMAGIHFESIHNIKHIQTLWSNARLAVLK